jgi:DNA gyrase subunit B
MSKNNYTSKDIKTLGGVEAIRTRPGMYIGTIDQDGIHHLILEVISNSIDEFLNEYGTEVVIDTKGKMFIIEDNGRGIPFGKTDNNTEALKDIVTSLHSGGKFGQGGYSVSGGLHGIGLTAVNALSEEFVVISSRENKTATLRAKKGQIISYDVKEDKNQKSTGTIIKFKPDPEIFGNFKINQKSIRNMVQELSYLTSGLKFKLNGETFLSKTGLKDMIESRVDKPITDVVYVSGEKEGFKVEVAFQYVDKSTDTIYAFTNNIPNPGGGTHVTGFKTAFTNSLNKLARSYGMLEDKDSNLNGDLLRRGLTAAISVKMAEAPVFKSQTKEKLMSPGARSVVSQLVGEAFDNNISKKDVKIIIDRAIAEQKALDAAKRAREAANKVKSGGKNMNSIKDLPSKLVDCKDRNGELWIVEGNSAGGNAKMCRDPKTQAILPLRGKVLNTHGKELADIIKNAEIKDMITAFGTGVANQFNINNFRYSKIIILADAK